MVNNDPETDPAWLLHKKFCKVIKGKNRNDALRALHLTIEIIEKQREEIIGQQKAKNPYYDGMDPDIV